MLLQVLIKSIIINKLPVIKHHLNISLCAFMLLVVLMGDAHGIRLTNVHHLFDIEHDFKQPSDVSVSKDGLIYVVDGVNNKIKVFNQKGEFIFFFGGRGSSKGRFQFPLGIDIDNQGRVYVADSGNRRVQVFNSRGRFLSQIKIESQGIKPADPTDIVVYETKNRLYVVDNDNHNILVYDLMAGNLIETFGGPGLGKREFRYPFDITHDNDDYLYVLEVINTRVQVLNYIGQFVAFIGGWGVEKGEFFRPKGIAIDRSHRVLVSDSYIGVIQVFNKNGEFYSVLGDVRENEVKKFKTPTGIFVDNQNRLYVVEMFADKVSVYKMGEDSE